MFKTKIESAKTTFVSTFQERPLETTAAIVAVLGITAKIIDTATQAQNAQTWRKEVKRRSAKN